MNTEWSDSYKLDNMEYSAPKCYRCRSTYNVIYDHKYGEWYCKDCYCESETETECAICKKRLIFPVNIPFDTIVMHESCERKMKESEENTL